VGYTDRCLQAILRITAPFSGASECARLYLSGNDPSRTPRPISSPVLSVGAPCVTHVLWPSRVSPHSYLVAEGCRMRNPPVVQYLLRVNTLMNAANAAPTAEGQPKPAQSARAPRLELQRRRRGAGDGGGGGDRLSPRVEEPAGLLACVREVIPCTDHIVLRDVWGGCPALVVRQPRGPYLPTRPDPAVVPRLHTPHKYPVSRCLYPPIL